MTTKLKTAAADAVRAWCKRQGRPATTVRHVFPRAYIIGRAAPMCMVVSCPWQDAEPQCQEFCRGNPLAVLHNFESGLEAGRWCAVAYVVRGDVSETVAVHFDA